MMKIQGRFIFLTLGLVALDIHSLAVSRVANAAAVYECVVAGQRTFSDQPCAKDAVQRELAEPNRMDAPKITRNVDVPQRRPVVKGDNKSSDDGLAQNKAACNKIRAQQRSIQDEMRAGYNAAKGERLKQRAQALTAEYASRRCERYR